MKKLNYGDIVYVRAMVTDQKENSVTVVCRDIEDTMFLLDVNKLPGEGNVITRKQQIFLNEDVLVSSIELKNGMAIN